MSVFGTAGRLCSWAKVAPRTVQSGRKTGRARTGKGNPYLKSALAQIATGAAKTDTFLGERYRRLIKRMPKAKALVALQRSILVIFFHLLADPTAEFTDLGSDFYQRRIDRARRTTHLLRQLHALGYQVQLTEPPPNPHHPTGSPAVARSARPRRRITPGRAGGPVRPSPAWLSGQESVRHSPATAMACALFPSGGSP